MHFRIINKEKMKYLYLLFIISITGISSAQTGKWKQINPNSGFDKKVINDSSISFDVGSNYFPLHKGNEWLFIYTPFFYNPNVPRLQQISIIKDTIINTTKYYSYWPYWSQREYLVRYSDKQKKIYFWYKDSEGVYMDFNLPEGALYERFQPFYEPATILEGKQYLFSDSVKYKGYSAGKAWSTYGVSTEKFSENIGPISYTYRCDIGHALYRDTTRLIMALIYDSTNTPVYYSNHYKTEISLKPVTTINSTPFQLNFSVNHKLGKLLIGPAYMESFYSKSDSVINNDTIHAILSSDSSSEFISFPMDITLLKTGYVFNYRIIARDKSLIPEYSYSPDSGYYECNWDTSASNKR